MENNLILISCCPKLSRYLSFQENSKQKIEIQHEKVLFWIVEKGFHWRFSWTAITVLMIKTYFITMANIYDEVKNIFAKHFLWLVVLNEIAPYEIFDLLVYYETISEFGCK